MEVVTEVVVVSVVLLACMECMHYHESWFIFYLLCRIRLDTLGHFTCFRRPVIFWVGR